ncbi:general odorant-binding protein 84a isoform X2 [Aricia agestis]|uniref:general odorant-binding protein 84a isoform X2 n=1 Tax=Aricia agestis TaxID=91739 RepID=UPI001C201F5B|nr:general odorant-binding protein 84a isoform X2 [Aricia agestis]
MKIILFLTFAVGLLFSTTRCEDKDKSSGDDKKKSSENKSIKEDFDLMQIMTDCNDTFRVEMTYLQSLNSSGSFPDETDKTPKCFLRCVLEKSEIASEDGVFDTERTAEIFTLIRGDMPINDVKETATECAERIEETCKCERSYDYLKCLFETGISKSTT